MQSLAPVCLLLSVFTPVAFSFSASRNTAAEVQINCANAELTNRFDKLGIKYQCMNEAFNEVIYEKLIPNDGPAYIIEEVIETPQSALPLQQTRWKRPVEPNHQRCPTGYSYDRRQKICKSEETQPLNKPEVIKPISKCPDDFVYNPSVDLCLHNVKPKPSGLVPASLVTEKTSTHRPPSATPSITHIPVINGKKCPDGQILLSEVGICGPY